VTTYTCTICGILYSGRPPRPFKHGMTICGNCNIKRYEIEKKAKRDAMAKHLAEVMRQGKAK